MLSLEWADIHSSFLRKSPHGTAPSLPPSTSVLLRFWVLTMSSTPLSLLTGSPEWLQVFPALRISLKELEAENMNTLYQTHFYDLSILENLWNTLIGSVCIVWGPPATSGQFTSLLLLKRDGAFICQGFNILRQKKKKTAGNIAIQVLFRITKYIVK